MQTFYRLTLLGTFASIGIALAIAVAVQYEAPQHDADKSVLAIRFRDHLLVTSRG